MMIPAQKTNEAPTQKRNYYAHQPAWEQIRKERLQKKQGYANLLTAAKSQGQEQFVAVQRKLAREDLFYLFVYLLHRKDGDNDWVYQRCKEVQESPDGNLDLWSRGHYKAIDVKEPVPTPAGWKNHGEIEPGDFVFGRDGNPVRVIARTSVYQDADCYRVTFDDGYSVVVSGEHLWTLEVSNRARVKGTTTRKGHKVVTINTTQLKNEVESAQNSSWKILPRVPNPCAVDYQEKELPLDPYCLGVWLGDGTASGNRITCGLDDYMEMRMNIEMRGYHTSVKAHSNAVTVCIEPGVRGKRGSSFFTNELRNLGVLNTKHIPEMYLLADIESRILLLQGLMDTDGSCHKNHSQAIFCQKNEVLARQVLQLINSLGMKATIAKRIAKYKGQDNAYFQVQFRAHVGLIPFKLKRKAERCAESYIQQSRYRMVKSVIPVETRPVSCIQVDSEDGIYLIGKNYVPTHNSSIITFGKTIQDILINPEDTFCIISYSKTMAEGFLAQIKNELTSNTTLKALFPEIIWQNPEKDAMKWSTKDGFSVKRRGNPKEQTVEAFGLVDSQPTGKHFRVLVFDDIVTQDSVTSPDMIEKTTTAWEASMNIGSDSDVYRTRLRYIGTRWHHADTWQAIMDRAAAKPRIYPCTQDGTLRGRPVFLPKEIIKQKYREMKARTFNAQMLLNPTPTEDAPFTPSMVHTWPADSTANLNIYMVVDPSARDPLRRLDSNIKRRRGDYTCIWVVGLGADKNIYVLDILRDKMGINRRVQTVFEMHAKWNPLKVGYETGSQESDADALNYHMRETNYRFSLTELPNSVPKRDRIENLQGYFEEGRIWLPETCWKTDWEGQKRDLVQAFIYEELLSYPYGKHDDMLDALSYAIDSRLGAVFPQPGDFRPGSQYDFRRGLDDYKAETDREYNPLTFGLE